MNLFKPSKAKIGTTFIFIIFYLLNSAMQSLPKEAYKNEVKKYYSFAGETQEIRESRDNFIELAHQQVKPPSALESEKILTLGYIMLGVQLMITIIISYIFACFIHRVRSTAPA
jgi:hypothetical protein